MTEFEICRSAKDPTDSHTVALPLVFVQHPHLQEIYRRQTAYTLLDQFPGPGPAPFRIRGLNHRFQKLNVRCPAFRVRQLLFSFDITVDSQ